MADAEFKLKKFFNSFRRKSKAWALRQVVYQSLNSAEIYGLYKKFHVIYPSIEGNSLIIEVDYKYVLVKPQEI